MENKQDSLMENGYAWMATISMVSMCGERKVTYWGCACPAKWVSPSYDMDTILHRGKFDAELRKRNDKEHVVIAQVDSLKELEESLLEKAKQMWSKDDI